MEFRLASHPITKKKLKPNIMKTKIWILVLAIVVSFGLVAAQERTITGKVTSTEDGSVLPGVNVVLKGTNLGTTTDSNGDYSLAVPAKGGTLAFSFVGLQTLEFKIGTSDVVNVKLQLDVRQLEEVVVTGMGVHKEKKALGYSTSSTKGAKVKRGDMSYAPMDYELQQPEWNTEEYDGISENIFHDAQRNPLSTFSIDVDAASYSNVRRFINNGQRPPKDAVRIEEMINYFDYDYEQPKWDDPFSIYTEIASAHGMQNTNLCILACKARRFQRIICQHLTWYS
jgi:Ca-activated chloride channel family protein